MRRQTARLFTLLAVMITSITLMVASCSSSNGQRSVFQNAPNGYYTYSVNVDEPADIMLYFINTSGNPVHLTSISIPEPDRAMRLINTSVYDTRKIGDSPATALGILPEECPRNFVPAPVSSLTVPGHSTSPWIASVTIKFNRPGTYWLHRFRIRYTTRQNSDWQYLIDPVRLTVRMPALPGPKPEPPNQC